MDVKDVATGVVYVILLVLVVAVVFSAIGGVALLLDMQSSAAFSHAHHNLFMFLKWGELGTLGAAAISFIIFCLTA